MKINQFCSYFGKIVFTLLVSIQVLLCQEKVFLDDAATIQFDDKIVVGRKYQIGKTNFVSFLRFNKNGGLDSAFGKGGKIEIEFTRETVDNVFDMGVQSDGKVLYLICYPETCEISRLNSNGSLDSYFNGSGKLSVSYKTDKLTIGQFSILADDKIIVTGRNEKREITSIRLNSDGTLDKTFGTNGRYKGFYTDLPDFINKKILGVSADKTLKESIGKSIVQKDGKIVSKLSRVYCPSFAYPCSERKSALVRFNKDGSFDKTFGKDGIVETNIIIDSFLIGAEGKIILFQSHFADNRNEGNGVLLRLENDGKRDSAFIDEIKKTDIQRFWLILMQSDGKIILSGNSLIRLNENGSIDTTFNESVIDREAFEKERQAAEEVKETKPKEIPKVISGGVLNNKAIVLGKPEYTAEAKAARAKGSVIVQITVDEDGNVIEAKAVSGNQLLFAAAEKAARESKFSRTNLSGQPVKVQGVLNFEFAP